MAFGILVCSRCAGEELLTFLHNDIPALKFDISYGVVFDLANGLPATCLHEGDIGYKDVFYIFQYLTIGIVAITFTLFHRSTPDKVD